MDYTAQGHTVGLAQRMEQLAAADSAYLTEHTARARRRLLRAARSRGVHAQGRARARSACYELEGAGDAAHAPRRLARARLLALRRPRRRDGGARGGAAARARAARGASSASSPSRASARAGCASSSSSAAGRAASRSTRPTASAHGKTVPFLPILELLRDFFGITEQDGDAAARREDRRHACCCSTTALTRCPAARLRLPRRRRPGSARRRAIDPEARQRQLFALHARAGAGAQRAASRRCC